MDYYNPHHPNPSPAPQPYHPPHHITAPAQPPPPQPPAPWPSVEKSILFGVVFMSFVLIIFMVMIFWHMARMESLHDHHTQPLLPPPPTSLFTNVDLKRNVDPPPSLVVIPRKTPPPPVQPRPNRIKIPGYFLNQSNRENCSGYKYTRVLAYDVDNNPIIKYGLHVNFYLIQSEIPQSYWLLHDPIYNPKEAAYYCCCSIMSQLKCSINDTIVMEKPKKTSFWTQYLLHNTEVDCMITYDKQYHNYKMSIYINTRHSVEEDGQFTREKKYNMWTFEPSECILFTD